MTKAMEAPSKIGKLETLSQVRLELGRLYRRAWAKKIDVGEATKFAFILAQVRQAIEAEVTERLEARLMTVEERLRSRIEAHHEARLN
jgi:hypothetical protein